MMLLRAVGLARDTLIEAMGMLFGQRIGQCLSKLLFGRVFFVAPLVPGGYIILANAATDVR